jgi:hypothetical protein
MLSATASHGNTGTRIQHHPQHRVGDRVNTDLAWRHGPRPAAGGPVPARGNATTSYGEYIETVRSAKEITAPLR